MTGQKRLTRREKKELEEINRQQEIRELQHGVDGDGATPRERYIEHCTSSDEGEKRLILILGLLNMSSSMATYYPMVAWESLKKEEKLELTDNQIYLMTTLYFLGAFFGSFLSGLFIWKTCRRLILHLCCCGLILSWMVIIGHTSYQAILIARIFGGVCTGIQTATIMQYSFEVLAVEYQPFLDWVMPFTEALGMVLMSVNGLFYEWRELCKLGIVLASFSIIVLYHLNSSPDLLFRKREFKEARGTILEIMGGNELLADQQFERVENRILKYYISKQTGNTLFRNVSHFPVYITIVLYACQQLTGISVLLCFITSITASTDPTVSTPHDALTMSLLYAASNIIYLRVQTNTQRKFLVRGSSLFMSLFSILFGALFYMKSVFKPESNLLMTVACFICLCAVILAYCYGWSSVPNLVYREYVPYNQKYDVTFLILTIKWLVTAIVTKTFLIVRCDILFIAFGIITFNSFLLMEKYLVETLGRTCEMPQNSTNRNQQPDIIDISEP